MSINIPGFASGWNYAAPAGGIINNTAVTLVAAPGVRVYAFVDSLDFLNANATATEVAIRSGAGGTVIWRGYAPASMLTPYNVSFNVPLKALATATLLEVVCLTTGAQVYFNAQGHLGTMP